MSPRLTKRSVARSVLAAAVGVTVGVGGYTFIYARGYSYMRDDPAACANCHVMNEQYDGWLKSSHRSAATCNDCHTPPGAVAKYMTKAKNGFWHSFYFTTGTFPEPIRISEHDEKITEQACRKCHAEITDAIDAHAGAEDGLSCVRCHRSVGHLH